MADEKTRNIKRPKTSRKTLDDTHGRDANQTSELKIFSKKQKNQRVDEDSDSSLSKAHERSFPRTPKSENETKLQKRKKTRKQNLPDPLTQHKHHSQKKRNRQKSDRATPKIEANEDNIEGTKTLPKKKKKRKKKQRIHSDEEEPGEIGLAGELDGLQDDIVEVSDHSDEPADTHWTAPTMHSEHVSRIFIERKSGFKSADKLKLAKREAEIQRQREAQADEIVEDKTTLSVALSWHKTIRTFSLFCHGLLAGLALWHVISVFSFSYEANERESDDYLMFLHLYQPMALPVQCAYYLLGVICTVSACDKFDVGRLDRKFLNKTFTLQNGAISVLFYFMGLIFSLSIANMDDKIWLLDEDPSLWEDDKDRSSDFLLWRVLNTVRGIFFILGWLVISITPVSDRLTKNLKSADENILDPNALQNNPENGQNIQGYTNEAYLPSDYYEGKSTYNKSMA